MKKLSKETWRAVDLLTSSCYLAGNGTVTFCEAYPVARVIAYLLEKELAPYGYGVELEDEVSDSGDGVLGCTINTTMPGEAYFTAAQMKALKGK